jgi:hypothetical protein
VRLAWLTALEFHGSTDRWAVARVTFMDASTEELRAAHDVLSEFYAERLAGALDHMPEERAVLRAW